RTSWTGSIDACSLRDRLILLAGAGLLGFVVSTPYAFLDLYYFRSMWSALRTVTADNLQQEKVTLGLCAYSFFTTIATTGAVLLLARFVRAVAVNFRGMRDPLIVFATTLAASQLLWFGLTSKVWIAVGYLILSIGLLSMLSFETLFVGFLAVLRIAKFPRRL